MISVIVPTYNRGSTIQRSIHSVLNQTYKYIELIIVDDCSNDDTEKVINAIQDERIVFIRHEVNKGACAARNTGIDVAKGEYIAFQDSDDEWKLDKLEMQLQEMKSHGAEISFCAMNRMNYGKTRSVFPVLEAGYKAHEDILMGAYVSTQTIMGKSAIFSKHKFDIGMPRAQDYDLIIRIAEEYNVYFLNVALVDVYMQGDSLTAGKNRYNKNKEIAEERILKKNLKNKEKYPLWNLKMLHSIAYEKTMREIKCTDIYLEIFKIEKTWLNLCKLVMCKLGMLHYWYTK